LIDDLPPGRPPGSGRRSAGRSLRNILLGITAGTTALVVGGVFYGGPRFGELLDIRLGPGAVQPGETGGVRPAAEGRPEAPPPGLEEADEPLGTPETPPYASDSYQFLATNIPEAIDTISQATGIRFIYDGATAEQPSAQRAPYQPDSYGDRWAPLLVSWTTPEVAPQLKGKVIGTGGSTHFSYDGGPKTFVTGSLELDSPQIAEELEQPDGKLYATAVILHELGHVMGLEHVDDHRQLMYPEIGTPEGLAAGDLNGLYELAGALCRKDL